MKTVKLLVPILVGKVHREEGELIKVTDGEAIQMVNSGAAELSEAEPRPTPAPLKGETPRIPGAVDPLIGNADPGHAARMQSAQVEDYPGLQALNDGNHPSIPKRTGRLAPETTVVDPGPLVASAPADPKPAKPPKG